MEGGCVLICMRAMLGKIMITVQRSTFNTDVTCGACDRVTSYHHCTYELATFSPKHVMVDGYVKQPNSNQFAISVQASSTVQPRMGNKSCEIKSRTDIVMQIILNRGIE